MDSNIRTRFDAAFMEFRRWATVALDPAKVRTEEEGNFLSVVSALYYSADRNYAEMCDAYDRQDQVSVAWKCRNLMEIAIYATFALQSKQNADDFAADRLIDGRDIGIALQKIVAELNPSQTDPDLEASLKDIEKKMAAEHVTRTQFLRIGDLAKRVNLRDEYDNLNRVCSKFVHPTAWSIFAMDELPTRVPSAGEILFGYGAMYLAMVEAEIRPHVKKYGLRHKP